MSVIRVMLADDHNLVRQGVRKILEMEEDIVVIGEADCGSKIVDDIRQGMNPNVVLLDICMPGMSGVETARRIRTLLPNVTVIGLSAVDEETLIHEMLNAGAYDYVNKNSAATELISTIRRAHEKQTGQSTSYSARVKNRQPQHYYTQQHSQQQHSPYIDQDTLTRRETDVMQMLLNGYSNKEIARQLIISERTVQTHLSNIFNKLDVHSRTEAVLVAVRDGWDRVNIISEG